MDTPQENKGLDPSLRGGGADKPQAELTKRARSHESGEAMPQAERLRMVQGERPTLSLEQLVDGRYRVCALIGQGGAGSVYLVEQVFLKQKFALKTLNETVSSDKTIRRFQQEAQAARSLNHPNLVRAVDFGLLGDGHPYFVMDLVEGDSLAQYLKKHGTLNVDEAVDIFVPICAGLDFAHKQGIVHRDIKPGNIVLVANSERGGWLPKIVDFGIAKWNSGELVESLTKTGDVFGTPLYMSPEQCLGAKIDQRSDIYSLGCVLFETLTGAPPFRGDNPLAVMMQHGTAAVPSMKEASLGREFPPALQSVLAKMLSKDPADRYQNCAELAHDFLLLQLGKLKSARQVRPTSNALLRVAASSLILVPAVVLAFYLLPSKPAIDSHQTRPNVFDIPASPSTSVRYAQWSFFRTGEAGATRTFIFPDDADIGSLDYWHNGKIDNLRAQGKVYVPSNAKVILSAVDPLFAPSYLCQFQSGDLWGAAFDASRGSFLQSENEEENIRRANYAVQHLAPISSLHYIRLKMERFLRETLDTLGKMPNLTWLLLDTVAHKPFGSAAVSGTELAKFQNLQQLEGLCVYHADSCGPFLEALGRGQSQLRRLSLQHCKVGDGDPSRASHHSRN